MVEIRLLSKHPGRRGKFGVVVSSRTVVHTCSLWSTVLQMIYRKPGTTAQVPKKTASSSASAGDGAGQIQDLGNQTFISRITYLKHIGFITVGQQWSQF